MGGEWREVALGSLTDNFDSARIPVKEADRRVGPYPYYGASGIVDHVDDYLFDGEYLLIAEDGENLRTRTTPVAFLAYGKFWVNNHAHIVRANQEADTRFLMYALSVVDISGHLTGSTMPKLTQSNMNRIPILAPPLPEQRAIAHILGTLDDKIELNRRMGETLEAMARALFKSWFVDFDPVRAKAEGRDPGLPKHLADLFPDSFEDSELGEIPAGWEVSMLGNVAENPRRGVQPEQIVSDTPYIALEHMPKRCIALSEWGTADGLESNKFQFKKGEILFGKLRSYFHKVGVAPIDGVCSTDIVVVAPHSMQWFGFVLGHVSSVAFVEYTNAGSTGTKMPRTSWHDMARYAIALPPKPLATAFTRLVQPFVDRVVAGIHESHTLATLRDTLLPKLISGELRVKAPSDRSAVSDRSDLSDRRCHEQGT
ncbi:MAG: restriction endonuclease subunit S [Anaerolineae bacterium]|nr:restriction endonuclease subunit S [Anaerolineae bacterium]